MKIESIKELRQDYIELALCYQNEAHIADVSCQMLEIAIQIIMECSEDRRIGLKRIRDATTAGIKKYIDQHARDEAHRKYKHAND